MPRLLALLAPPLSDSLPVERRTDNATRNRNDI
ncbi:hypothetical protein ABIC21_001557 [Pseudarthrobacter sp. PvP090]